jgi:hypothetical protein
MMTMVFATPRQLFRVLALAALTACTAPGHSGAAATDRGADADQVIITVRNDRRPFAEVTVLVYPGAAEREQTLGTVPPGETRTFTYRGLRGSYGSHYLLARRPNLSPLARSRSFNMPESGHIEWSTRLRRAVVHSQGDVSGS